MTNLFIISGPSGSGQDTIIEELQKRGLPIERVITTTTRPMRRTESEGKPYFFISQDEFQEKIRGEVFFEWAEVYHEYYGVTREEIERVEKSKKIGIWKMDYKGVKSAKENISGIIAIMLKPASIQELEERLRARSGSNKTYEERLEYSKEFLRHEYLYDYVVVNTQGELEKAVSDVEKIILKHAKL